GSGTVGAGLGLGLFGVLSIIRLRSEELAQHEVAYYFAALALGLTGGLLSAPSWLSGALMLAVLLSIFVGDHPRVVGPGRTQEVLVDRAFTDESRLVTHLEALLGAHVQDVSVGRTDLVNDTTLVRVRYSPNAVTAPRTVATHELIEHPA
ncbi:MAG: DUF4956 domain-containing protein, partial [Nocardioides sp.]|uniref:DUF4956 domain-containing protein n=1 Tax=Nocardioides sp. TaxID=35761 RepID=UPI0032675770